MSKKTVRPAYVVILLSLLLAGCGGLPKNLPGYAYIKDKVLYIMDHETILNTIPVDGIAEDPVFSPDGNLVALVFEEDSDATVLIQRLDEARPMSTFSVGGGAIAEFSWDSKRLLVTTSTDAFIADLEGNRLQDAPRLAYPDWSPYYDEDVIAGTLVTPEGTKFGLFGLDGSQVIVLSDDGVRPGTYAFDPLDKKLLFSRDGEIWRVDIDGSNLQSVMRDKRLFGPSKWQFGFTNIVITSKELSTEPEVVEISDYLRGSALSATYPRLMNMGEGTNPALSDAGYVIILRNSEDGAYLSINDAAFFITYKNIPGATWGTFIPTP